MRSNGLQRFILEGQKGGRRKLRRARPTWCGDVCGDIQFWTSLKGRGRTDLVEES